MKKLIKRICRLITSRQQLIIIFWLFFISLFLRSFLLSHYISFHQDQVRDLFYIKEHFEEKKLILLGPKASVGDFYLPPFWYYLMSFSYLFSKSPLSPAFLTALFGALTSVFIYIFVKKYFDKQLAFIASLLYSVSPLAIEYSRFAWNPNPIPFFVILTFYFLYQFLIDNDKKSFYFGIITSNLVLQLHYQGLVIFIFYFLAIIISKKFNLKKFIQYILINLILVFPFIIYEFQNNFRNTLGIINFLIQSQSLTKLKLFGIPFFIKFIIFDFSSFLGKLLFFKNQILGYLSLLILFISIIINLFKFNKISQKLKILSLFLIFSFLMLFFYKNSLIDFYLLFLIPIIIVYFILIFKNLFGKKTTVLFFFFIILINLIKSPAFGAYDKAYLWLNKSIKIISSEKDYCLSYNIFPQNFIENKHRYMMTLVKNQPVYKNCDFIMSFRCDKKVKTGYYLCEKAICQQKPIDISFGKLIDMKELNSDVKIYKFDY